jgi:hypothetical protein
MYQTKPSLLSSTWQCRVERFLMVFGIRFDNPQFYQRNLEPFDICISFPPSGPLALFDHLCFSGSHLVHKIIYFVLISVPH